MTVSDKKAFAQKVKKIKVFQKKVLERFLTEEQMATLENGYRANRIKVVRGDMLIKPLLVPEKEMLKDYLEGLSVVAISEKYGISRYNVETKTGKIASRLLYQNKEIIGLDKILSDKGGDEDARS